MLEKELARKKMVKRKKAGEKEMGGAEKLRNKKIKLLEQDAAKCAKLPDFFQGGRSKEDAASEYCCLISDCIFCTLPAHF